MYKSELKCIIQKDGVVNSDGWIAVAAHCIGDCVGVGGSSESVSFNRVIGFVGERDGWNAGDAHCVGVSECEGVSFR